jgi:tetratricopeptide (TPR) repeat protein
VHFVRRALSGTLVLRGPVGDDVRIYFRRGAPAKLASDLTTSPLGEILVRMGALTAEELDDACARARLLREPVGVHLVREGWIERPVLHAALRRQILERLAAAQALPPHATFEFYESVDLATDWRGEEPVPCDPLAALMATVRAWREEDRAENSLARLAGVVLRLHPDAAPARFGLLASERLVVDAISTFQPTLEILRGLGLDEAAIRATVYALAIACHLSFGREPEPPLCVATTPVVVEDRVERRAPRRDPRTEDDAEVVTPVVPPVADVAAQDSLPAGRAQEADLADTAERPLDVAAELSIEVAIDEALDAALAPAPAPAQDAAHPREEPEPHPTSSLPPISYGAGPSIVPRSFGPMHAADLARSLIPPAIELASSRDDEREPEPQSEVDRFLAAGDEFAGAERALAAGDFHTARRQALAAAEADPSRAEYRALATFARALGAPAYEQLLALQALDRILREEPRSSRATRYRAQLLHLLGRTDEAKRDYQAALGLDPVDDVAAEGLAALSAVDARRAREAR